MTVVMIRLGEYIGDGEKEKHNELIEMLNILLSNKIENYEKKKLLSKYGVSLDSLGKDELDMCNLGETIHKKAFIEGVNSEKDKTEKARNEAKLAKTETKQAIEKGILVLINTLKKVGWESDMIISHIAKEYGLKENEVREYYNR